MFGYKLITKGTIEEKIPQTPDPLKAELFESLITSDEKASCRNR